MLRQLLITRKIADARRALQALVDKATGFATRRAALTTREAELSAALAEVTEDTPQEERDALETEIDAHAQAVEALDTEETEADEEQRSLTEQIAGLEAELTELNARSSAPAAQPAPQNENRSRRDYTMGYMRFFRDVPVAERTAIVERAEVREFLERVRSLGREERAVNGAALLIPDILLSMMRDQLNDYSKLASRVNLVRVPGTARQNIAGTIPEGVWTEMCASLNELSITFNQVEVDGYKVGGFISVCKAVLEDSDINLTEEIMWNISQALGFALDKAILYGTGTKMPLGIMPRLAQTAQPSNWGAHAPAWVDLHESNLLMVDGTSLTDIKFYQALILAMGVIKPNYSNGAHFWATNTKTYAKLQAKALVFNAAGAIVSGQTRTMPIVGGDIVTLDFIPDNDIIGGYGSLYLLAERAGMDFAQSEHYRFIEEQIVFKGTARYDGKPVFGEGFVAVNIANAAPTTAMAFAPDTANTETP